MAKLRAWIGVDANERTQGGAGSVVFVVTVGGRELYRSGVLRGGQEPVRLDVALSGARGIELVVEDGGDGPACDHADWADAIITLADGSESRLSDMPEGTADLSGRYPFSFSVGGRPCDDVLPGWAATSSRRAVDLGRTVTDCRWDDPSTGLRVELTATRFSDYSAVEWVMRFENRGAADTPLIENVLPVDMTLTAPRQGEGAASSPRLHRTAGGTPTPDQFESTVSDIGGRTGLDLRAGAGRSSTRDLPFFKVEMGDVSYVVAIGWSGDWTAHVESPARQSVHVAAGQTSTRFVLHPGERVRTPSVLVLRSAGHTLEANALFRQLIYKHFAARRSGKPVLPVLFSNTCFTRGGGWLNECNAENQISLIKAYAPLGLEAVITDAGWFEGGWPDGAGNWGPRKDAYPNGMGPVAAAAAERKMTYGLWFEPERVVAGTSLHREHPAWCLAAGTGPQTTYLANFGLQEVRDHFFNIVKGFMALPGFRVYRQDFNMDPLPYWKHNDAPDRVGVTEMQYIEGLYAYWDRLAATWPDGLREECASGGHRMDLETVKRFHMHQKTDYWFDNEVDQASIWALSQYLPNSAFVAPINRLDDYTFRSVFPTSLCIGWIADAQEFPAKRASALLRRYLALRHLLVGAYYPLTGYSRTGRDWMAMQFHRPDLDAGMILVIRRKDSPYRSIEVALRGVRANGSYELRSETSGLVTKASGASLRKQMVISLPEPGMTDILVYSKAKP
jgi:alpha-galactosidase